MTKTNKITSLYCHIPFCENICDYCDFVKLQYFHNFAVSYITQLKNQFLSLNIDVPLKTIYVGGGTPTSLEDDLFLDLISFLSNHLDKDYEFTVECNPESLTPNKIDIMKRYKVNRVSIGVESTSDKVLKSINRKHTFLDVKKANKLLIESGINNINFDLILGLPNVTINMLKNDIDNLIALNPKQISCYGLTVHEHTQFHNKNILPPNDDELRKMYDLINEKLVEAGFIHYEVSAWCKPGYESKHNLVYWRNEQYYAIGLGASGYIDNVRFTNTKNLHKYLKDFNALDNKEVLTKSDIKTYFLLTNLRTRYGINLALYKQTFNEDFYLTNKDYIDTCLKEKLLIFNIDKDYIYATYEGMMILDQILLNLI